MTIPEALKQLRTESGWYVGDRRAAEVLEAFARDRDATIAQLDGMLRQAKEQLEDDIYRTEHLKAIEACMWMHDDKTLDIPLGAKLTSDGVTALRKQRDELRAQLAAMQSRKVT